MCTVACATLPSLKPILRNIWLCGEARSNCSCGRCAILEKVLYVKAGLAERTVGGVGGRAIVASELWSPQQRWRNCTIVYSTGSARKMTQSLEINELVRVCAFCMCSNL